MVEYARNICGLENANSSEIDPETIWEHHLDIIRAVRGKNIHFVVPTAIGSVTIINDLKKSEFIMAYKDRALTNKREYKGQEISPSLIQV